MLMRTAELLPRDPRLWQIVCLSSLAAFGSLSGAFGLSPFSVGATLVGALGAQVVGSRLAGIPLETRSALITTLSLTILVRADAAWLMGLAGVLAIGSKFVIRAGGKHVFNPANFALVVLSLGLDGVWTSPGQWGTSVLFAAIFAGLGAATTARASRLDTPLVFLAAYAALVLGRAAWLGDPWAIPFNSLQNGALIVFAFFMISDPKTTPDERLARWGFVSGVALLGFLIQFNLHIPDGIFYALFLASLVRPVIEFARPARHFEWPTLSLPASPERSAP